MKLKTALVLACTAMAAASASAGVIIPQVSAFPPGPTIIAVLARLFGGQ